MGKFIAAGECGYPIRADKMIISIETHGAGDMWVAPIAQLGLDAARAFGPGTMVTDAHQNIAAPP